MKAISIRQPWASLSAAGIRDIDISTRTTNYRGPVLLVASARKVGRDFGHDIPVDWYCRVRNAQALGLIGYDEELPVSCVVGVAYLENCTEEMQDSPWSTIGNNWVLRDAKMFKTPIFGIKGKQGLFDLLEINEDIVPSAIAQITPWSTYREGIFSLSMTEEEIERQIPGWPLVLTICDDGLTSPIIEKESQGYKIKPVSQVILTSPLSSVSIAVSRVQVLSEEKEGKTIHYVALELAK